MPSIFISYSHDDLDVAKDLKKYLEDHQYVAWLDIKDLETGDRWKNEISGAIRTCSAFVVIATPRAERSHWVMRELSYAIELEKPILSLKHEGDLWPVLEEYQCAASFDDLITGLGHLTQILVWHLPDRPEDAAFAQQLSVALADAGASLWQGDINSLPQVLDKTNIIMLLVISPESMQSRPIRELRRAFDRANKDVIPILFRHSTVSHNVRRRQPYIDFLNQDFSIAFAQLCGRLKELKVPLKATAVMPIPPQPPLLLDGIQMFEIASSTVWISGLILDTFAPFHEKIASILREKPDLTIRIMTISLDVQIANETGDWVGINRTLAQEIDRAGNPEFEAWCAIEKDKGHTLSPEGRWVALRLFRNQQHLRMLKNAVGSQVEIRTSRRRPGMGYFIIDPYTQSSESMLIATPYFYQIDTVKGESQIKYNMLPIFLSKSSSIANDLWWFDEYVREFERLWQDAVPWHSDQN